MGNSLDRYLKFSQGFASGASLCNLSSDDPDHIEGWKAGAAAYFAAGNAFSHRNGLNITQPPTSEPETQPEA